MIGMTDMQLNFEQIKSVTQGAVYITKEDEKITFHRFSREEEDLYAKTQFRDKIYSTAGVQMVFATDADSIYISVETAPATSRQYFSVDIFVDGEVRQHIQNFDENAVNYALFEILAEYKRCGVSKWDILKVMLTCNPIFVIKELTRRKKAAVKDTEKCLKIARDLGLKQTAGTKEYPIFEK